MKKLFALLIAVFAFEATFVSAHDTDYGKTHNHYDYVVVAHIDSYTEETVDLTIVKYIISSESCGDNEGSHIPPEKMTVILRDKVVYPDAYEQEYGILKSGIQNIVAVINKEGGQYRFLWIYETDSDDYRTLQIISPKMKDSDMISGDTAAFNDFINSNGKYCDHSFQGFPNPDGSYKEEVTRRFNGKSTVIYTTDEGYIAVRRVEQINRTYIFSLIILLVVIAIGVIAVKYIHHMRSKRV